MGYNSLRETVTNATKGLTVKMIYIETGTVDACLNFATEYYFAAEKQLSDDVLMLWQTVPTLMLGKYQNPYEEIDLNYAAERGICLVRRLSGGGTIYTDPGGFQFSFIGSGSGEIEFERYITPVVEALRTMGIPAEADGRNDIIADGRKISGNAQYKAAGRTVHHGSLLFSTDIGEMERATALPGYKIRSKAIKSVRERVVNISELPELIDKRLTPGEFKSKLLSLLPVTGEYILSEDDKCRIAELAEEKFRSESTVFGSTPNFTAEKECHTSGGTVILGFEVKRGIITDVSVRGDFFSAGGVEALRDALIGTVFQKDAVKSAVAASGFEAFGTTAAELAEAIL